MLQAAAGQGQGRERCLAGNSRCQN
jgi:hypothetical protein